MHPSGGQHFRGRTECIDADPDAAYRGAVCKHALAVSFRNDPLRTITVGIKSIGNYEDRARLFPNCVLSRV